MYTSRGWTWIGLLVLLAAGTGSCVLKGREFVHLLRESSDTPWGELTEWGFTTVFVLTTLLFVINALRRKSKSIDSDTLVQLITPFMAEAIEPANGDPRKVPPSVYHLLQSLDVQRNIMRRCFEHAPFGVVFLARRQSIVYANPVFLQMAGRTASELYNKQEAAFQSLFVQEGTDDWFSTLGQTSGALERSFGYLRTEDDTLLPVLVTGFPLTGNKDAEPAGFILFLEDISPSHQVRILQQQHSFVLNSLHHGVVVTDLDFEISYANGSFAEMFGLEHATMIGQTLGDIVPLESGLSCQLARLALASGESQFAQFAFPLPDGGARHIQVTATPLRDTTSANMDMGMLLLYQDRSAEVELQETMRRNDQLETVSQMAASIAHEVRNPMTSVQGFLQLMAREIDPKHTHSMYLSVMEEDLKRINGIITEYLNFSRMDNGAKEDVRIGTLLHNTFTLLQSEANLKGIQIELRLPDTDPVLTANPNSLKQVLINLARNAMEAMDELGGGQLTLSLEETPDGVCLLVQDTGPGITPDHLARIFSPFYTTKHTGTGLGLFISKKIIEEHHGTLQVTTELGVGTAFRILLPC